MRSAGTGKGDRRQGGYIMLSIMILSMVMAVVGTALYTGLYVADDAAIETHLYQLRNHWGMVSGHQYLSYRAMAGSATCPSQQAWQTTLMGTVGSSNGFFHELENLASVVTLPAENVAATGNPILRTRLQWDYPLPADRPAGSGAYRLDLYFTLARDQGRFRLESYSALPTAGVSGLVPIVQQARGQLPGVAYTFTLGNNGYATEASETIWPY